MPPPTEQDGQYSAIVYRDGSDEIVHTRYVVNDAVPNLLIFCRLDLAGGKHAEQLNELVDNTMMARSRSK